jgi:hypothetical protein
MQKAEPHIVEIEPRGSTCLQQRKIPLPFRTPTVIWNTYNPLVLEKVSTIMALAQPRAGDSDLNNSASCQCFTPCTILVDLVMTIRYCQADQHRFIFVRS